MKGFVTAKEAAHLIKNGDTVASAGMALMGLCEDVIRSTEARFLETGEPKNLTLFYGAHQGNNPITEYGWDHWAHEGMLKRWNGGFLGASPKIMELCNTNKIEAYCWPMGNILHMYHEIAIGRPGLMTKIGLKTYADPRLEGSKVNQVSTEDICKVINFEGEEYLFYPKPVLNVGLIRGTTVDTHGNLTFEEESINSEALSLAMSVKQCGGIVIAQAKYKAAAGTIHPRTVHVPGIFIDYVVINEDIHTHQQNEASAYNPAMAGNIKADLAEFPKLPLTEAKVIARRAAMELKKGTSINLGIGIPQNIASVVNEEKCGKYVTLTSESGTVGGVAITGKAFGNCWNPECFLDEDVQFTWYCGGGLGAAFLGLAETDERGNVNVSKFGPRFNGPGGFIDITQPTKKVIFCGAFMAGKLQTEVKDGKIHIINEGKFRKFVSKVGQVTFSGDYAVESGQDVMYITERGVFELTKDGLMLTEIAPGIDLEKDILANMDFKPVISPDLKEMDAALFREDWGGLKVIMEG